MKQNVNIHIEQLLGKDVRTRSRIRIIVAATNQDADYTLDFKNVEFISRSFADELISFIQDTPHCVKTINMHSEVAAMLDIVRKSRSISKPKYVSTKVEDLTNMQEVQAYFDNM